MSSNLSSNKVIALVDCNSFYASCERVFNPRLRNKPVVVLSNNDGCIVALSEEAKQVGIKMGSPIFQVKDLVQKHQVQVYSSNYTLYGDMSARVMQVLSEFTPELEIYSIDEAFLNLEKIPKKELTEYGQMIRKKVLQYTGIPVSVGIAETKVLAKFANRIAKKRKLGSFSTFACNDLTAELKKFPIEDLWGIGRRSTRKLNEYGIVTAFDFKMASPQTIRKLLTVVGSRIQRELHGESCIDLALNLKPKKQIISSRSFGDLLTELPPIQEAIANHATRAAEKLRKQKSVCFVLQVFLHTNPFRNQDVQYYASRSVTLPYGVNETNTLIRYAQETLDALYRPNFKFKKCGIILLEIHPENENQQELFAGESIEKAKIAIASMDQINAKFGTDVVKFAACGTEKHWQMRSEHRSARFTTHWGDLLEVF